MFSVSAILWRVATLFVVPMVRSAKSVWASTMRGVLNASSMAVKVFREQRQSRTPRFWSSR